MIPVQSGSVLTPVGWTLFILAEVVFVWLMCQVDTIYRYLVEYILLVDSLTCCTRKKGCHQRSEGGCTGIYHWYIPGSFGIYHWHVPSLYGMYQVHLVHTKPIWYIPLVCTRLIWYIPSPCGIYHWYVPGPYGIYHWYTPAPHSTLT